jgi:hypothetical protein
MKFRFVTTIVATTLVYAACTSAPTRSATPPSESASRATPLATQATSSPALSTPSPTAATATASPSELVAVAKAIYPYSSQFNYYVVCGQNGNLSECPITERLKTYLTEKQTTLCGCQNPAPSLDITATPTSTGGVAHVVLGYQPTPLRFDLVIIRAGGHLLVDDQLCTGGGASTSIYVRSGGC